MNVALKNVKVNERLSEETTCFSASIYIDGVKVGEASNRGQGGSTQIRFQDSKKFSEFLAYCKTLPPLPVSESLGGGSLAMDAELFIDELLNKHQTDKEKNRIRNKLAGATLFLLANESIRHGYREIKAPYSEKIKAYLVSKYGNQLGPILNEKPELIDTL